MPTQSSFYNIGKNDIEKVVQRFEKRKTIVGERQVIGAAQVREILLLCV
jgi:hypothetical protein